MSDLPNGRPPGQNNLHAGTEPYVPKENDPSAGAQKPDEDRPKEDGIEVRNDETDEETKQELLEASKNIVQPSTAEEPEEPEHKPQVRTQSQRVDPNETKPTTPGSVNPKK